MSLCGDASKMCPNFVYVTMYKSLLKDVGSLPPRSQGKRKVQLRKRGNGYSAYHIEYIGGRILDEENMAF